MALGVYVLGAVDPLTRSAIEAHLDTCADCRAEWESLAGLPAVLDQVTLDDLSVAAPANAPEASADLFDRILTQARAEEQHRPVRSRTMRHRWVAAVAAAVVLIAGVGVGVVVAGRDHGAPSGSVADTRVGVNGDVRMTVALAAQTTGTSIKVAVSGLPNDEHCRLIAVAKDGTRDVAGRWDATYEGSAQQVGSTRIPRDQLAKLVLVGTGGHRLVQVTV